MELLKDFDIQKYLDKKPPSNNSFTTKQEIKALAKTPMNKNFIKEKDDMVKVFDKITGDGKAAQELINQTSPVILKIKKHHNRPRPKVLAKKLNIKISDSLNGTTILNTYALIKNANILRVHDVKEAKECVNLLQELK